MSAAVLLDPARLDRPDTTVQHQPFPFMMAHGQLPDEVRDDLDRDFPRYTSAGFFPYDPADCGPSVNALIDNMTAPTFARAIGERLGVDHLEQYPTLVTLCRLLNKRHGTIHTDSKSKVVTALIYLNPRWPDTSDGCLRFLRSIDDIDSVVVPELAPLYGEFAVFKRCENSFHGHLPYEGERRVIQVAWLTSEEEKRRKTKRGKFSRVFKKLFGRFDTRLGAGRDRSASHRD
ncbi:MULTISPECIES: 2OG-Fe(II) oxygenase [Rhodanobacter]|uniref:2OG-Fe(II) oxygenase n=1 Tax=Rhodanobacter TaxID=75309 RepID=UPI0004239164|nr:MULTISPECIES: 2OG-Fe(II) oxygenase [Rhodanobacter]TAN18455.1 MAG: 2OG-Fe(II) oxygenase [Rhodanobacter sp.]UJJ53584.1 2OG-Fe(II) oxygenase [Rhodanobacter thiooxydans]